MVKDCDTADPARRWGFVMAIVRTWKTVEEKSITNLVLHVPQQCDPGGWTQISVRNLWASRCERTCWCSAYVITRWSLENPGVSFSFSMRCGYES
jgi:hypothetical protein